MKLKFLFGIALSAAAAGCTTAEQATQKAAVKWVGRSSDQFFAFYGAPYSIFNRDDGGKLYKWRGGEKTIRRPLNKPSLQQPNNGFGQTSSRSTTTVTQPDANTTITRTRSRSSSFNVNVDEIFNAPKPAYQEILVYCELSISTDAGGVITSMQPLSDSGGTFSLSRCDEVLNS